MHGYQPPWRTLPTWGAGYERETAPRLPETFRIMTEALEIQDQRDCRAAPICVMTDLIRHHGLKIGSVVLQGADVRHMRGFIHEQLGIKAPMWPLSFQAIADVLQGGVGRPYVAPQRGDIDLTGDMVFEDSDHGHRFDRLTVLSVPSTRWSVQSAIAAGYPVACGIGITTAFDDAASGCSGALRLPSPGEPMVDGSAVGIVGWDDDSEVFIFRSVMGDGWGDRGYGEIPYRYVVTPGWCHELVILASV